jgi:hypothetical protein
LPHKKFKASLRGEQEVSPGRRESFQLVKEDPTHDLRGGFNKKAMLSEMGISEEGHTSGALRGTERRGLGAVHSSGGGTDMFDTFRNSRSKRYHVAAEERSKGIGREESQLCYIC